MFKKRIKTTEHEEAQYYADFYRTKKKILDLADDMKEKYSQYYHYKVNRKTHHPGKFHRLTTALKRLYDEVKPKLLTSTNENIKEVIRIMDANESSATILTH
jgi:hypothetical protein